MKEDFKKYSLLQLFQVLSYVKKEVIDWGDTVWTTDEEEKRITKEYKKWIDIRSRIKVEILNRT